MNRFTTFILLILACAQLPASAADEPAAPIALNSPISVCVEDRFWPPSSFFLDGEGHGLQIAMIRHLMTALGIEHTFQRMPWNRCFASATEGNTDAILGMLYIPDRAARFHFPAGADKLEPIPEALQLIDFLIITRVGTKEPDFSNGGLPPSTIGVAIGYPAAASYREKGASVVEVSNHKGLFDLLIRGRVNSLHVAEPLYDFFQTRPAYAGKFNTKPNPKNIGPLYIGFSKNTTVPQPVIERIWQELAKVRADKTLMQTLRHEAYRMSTVCLKTPSRCE